MCSCSPDSSPMAKIIPLSTIMNNVATGKCFICICDWTTGNELHNLFRYSLPLSCQAGHRIWFSRKFCYCIQRNSFILGIRLALERNANVAVMALCFWFQCVKNSEINCSKLLMVKSLFSLRFCQIVYHILYKPSRPIMGINGDYVIASLLASKPPCLAYQTIFRISGKY